MPELNLAQMILANPNLADSRAPGVVISNVFQLGKMEVLNLRPVLERFSYMRPDAFDHAQGPTVTAEAMDQFIQDVFEEWDASVGNINPPELRARHFGATHVKVGTFRMDVPPSKNARQTEQSKKSRKAGADAYMTFTMGHFFIEIRQKMTDSLGREVDPDYVEYNDNVPGPWHAFAKAIKNYDFYERQRITRFNRDSCLHAARKMIIKMSQTGLQDDVQHIDPLVDPPIEQLVLAADAVIATISNVTSLGITPTEPPERFF